MVFTLRNLASPSAACAVHHKATEFLCEECSCYLCSECLFAELQAPAHSGHHILRLSDVLARLKSDLLTSIAKLLNVTRRIEAQACAIATRAYDLESSVVIQEELVLNYEDSIGEIISEKVDEHRLAVGQAVKTLEECLETATRIRGLAEVETAPQGIVRLTDAAQHVRTQIETAMKPIPMPSLEAEFVPPFVEHTFEIRDFRAALHPHGPEFLVTREVIVYGSAWRLKIHPRGNMDGVGKHVSVFLELMTQLPEPGVYECCLEIKNHIPGQQSVAKSFKSPVVQNSPVGWNKTIALEKVRRGGFLGEAGELVIGLKLRPESYYQAFMDVRAALATERECVRALTEQPPGDLT
jgi:hypothetical protein